MTTYLIVGNGVAGNAAAQSIRKSDPEGKILMFSREKHYFYYTPALPEYLAGEKEVKDFTIHDAPWYEKNGIELFLETEIAKIELPENRAVTHKGNKFSFHRLLLACGGKSLVPPIPGSTNDGVLTLRTVDDADGIRKRARGSKRMVVIGVTAVSRDQLPYALGIFQLFYRF